MKYKIYRNPDSDPIFFLIYIIFRCKFQISSPFIVYQNLIRVVNFSEKKTRYKFTLQHFAIMTGLKKQRTELRMKQ